MQFIKVKVTLTVRHSNITTKNQVAKDTFFQKKLTINAGGKLIDLSIPKVMGIINLTPDSFYAGSRKPLLADALQQANKMLAEGADFLDIGAYSSRPGAEDISLREEIMIRCTHSGGQSTWSPRVASRRSRWP